MALSIALGGVALHSGVPTSVLLARGSGPTVLEQGGHCRPLCELVVARADGGVAVSSPDGSMRIDLVEHVLAALGGLSLESGVRVVVGGPEPPLLDGGAVAWVRALRRLGLGPQPRTCRIACSVQLDVHGSRYELSPDDATRLEVSVEFAHPLVVVPTAQWDGTPAQFEERIAPARTFGFFEDWSALKAAGRARGANVRDVVVLCRDGTTLSDPPPEPDECARHKLLDLVGDLMLCGGVPRGRIRVVRPGHRANLDAFARAWAMGAVVPEENRCRLGPRPA